VSASKEKEVIMISGIIEAIIMAPLSWIIAIAGGGSDGEFEEEEYDS
jgi:hypothetical protein